ncbi:YybH family protein [Acidobacteriota bacterium]
MDLDQIRQAIGEGNAKFGEVVRSGDATALASLYTEDTRLLDPKVGMIQGREGVEAYWAGAFQMGIKEVVLTTVEVMGMDDMVCEFGKADLTIQPEGKDEIKDKGKYLVIWKKAVDSTWKMYVDIIL